MTDEDVLKAAALRLDVTAGLMGDVHADPGVHALGLAGVAGGPSSGGAADVRGRPWTRGAL